MTVGSAPVCLTSNQVTEEPFSTESSLGQSSESGLCEPKAGTSSQPTQADEVRPESLYTMPAFANPVVFIVLLVL